MKVSLPYGKCPADVGVWMSSRKTILYGPVKVYVHASPGPVRYWPALNVDPLDVGELDRHCHPYLPLYHQMLGLGMRDFG